VTSANVIEPSRADSERSGSSKVKTGRYADRVGSDSIVVGRDLLPVTECTASVIRPDGSIQTKVDLITTREGPKHGMRRHGGDRRHGSTDQRPVDGGFDSVQLQLSKRTRRAARTLRHARGALFSGRPEYTAAHHERTRSTLGSASAVMLAT
jgi:hypothetical protein